MRNGTRITDEYAAAMVDSRSRVHFGDEPALTLQLPQRAIAEALVEHWGCGELFTYESPTNGKTYNNITIKEPDLTRVLLSVRPYLISRARIYVDAHLRINGSEEVA